MFIYSFGELLSVSSQFHSNYLCDHVRTIILIVGVWSLLSITYYQAFTTEIEVDVITLFSLTLDLYTVALRRLPTLVCNNRMSFNINIPFRRLQDRACRLEHFLCGTLI